jgi:ribosome production factor 2
MVFHSDLFDTHPTFIQLKSFFLDFYNGHALSELPYTSIEHVISLTAGPLISETTLPKIHFRVYTTKLLSSGTKTPRLEMTEMGPSIDFSLRRVQEADPDMMKMATKRPKVSKKDTESGLGKKKKNIETDAMGDRVGKIHLKKQDLTKMQGRKVRALRPGGGKKVKSDGAESEGMDQGE